MCEDALNEHPKCRAAGKIRAVASEINPGQDHFLLSAINRLFHGINNEARRDRTAFSATVGDDAKCTAMITTILYLDKGARVIRAGNGGVR